MSAQLNVGTLLKSTLLFVSVMSILVACSPKVYLIDNQTVLEEEAAGAWPQFEKQILDKAKAKGPAPVSQIPPDKHRQRLYNVMNGEMPVTSATSTAATASTKSSKAGSGAGVGK